MKKLFNDQRIIIIMVLVLVLNVSLLYLVQLSWMQSASNFLPIIKNTSYLKYELASEHIWLEEFLQGDETVDLDQEVFARQKRVIKLYTGIKNSILKADLSSEIFDKITNIEIAFNELEVLTKERLKNPSTNLSGSQKDIIFDKQYNNLQNALGDFEYDLDDLLRSEHKKKNIFFTLMILFFIIFNSVTFYLFYRSRQKNLLFQAEVQEQKKAFETIYQKSTDGIVLSKNNLVIDCNESFLKMMQAKDKNEILNLHPSEFSPILQPDGKDSYVKSCEMLELCEKNGNHHFEWMHKDLNGKNFMVELVLTNIKLNDEEVMHTVVRDISQRIKLEQDYKEVQESMFEQSKMAQMGAMLSNIAHQWKQPLAKINSRLIDLSSSLNLKEKEQDILDAKIEKVEELTRYLANTIENFRTYFKPKKHKSSFSLKETLQKAISLSSVDDMQKSIDIMIKCDENIKLYEFEDQLLQVIIILLNNAKEAHENNNTEKPYIKIEVIDYGISISISVVDNAGGIDNAIINDIYTPYFSTKKSSNNSGIGLYMAKAIVEHSLKSTLHYIKRSDESYFIFNCNVTKKDSE